MPLSKELIFHDEARSKMLRGVDALAAAVRVTLGPRGRTVVVEDDSGNPRVVNSGVVVARSITLEDRFENMGVQLLREVASRTSETAGDGTTTATVLAHSMIHEGMRCLASGMNPMKLQRGMDRAVLQIVERLRGMARPCNTSQEVAHVAAISANNDESIGALLAAAIDKVGHAGAISVEEGSGLRSVLEIAEGMQFGHGYLSPYFVNDAERQCVVLEDVLVLLCDGSIAMLRKLLPLLDAVAQAGRPLLLIAEDVDMETLSTLVLNQIGGALKTCAVKAPGFGDARKAMLRDMAILTGARVVAEHLGLPLDKVVLSDLGKVRRAVIDKDSTTLIGGAGDAAAIQSRIADIRAEQKKAETEHDRDSLGERAARLSGGVAVIKIGAATETELRERKLRVEDALHATRAAVDEGIVPGGGVALLRARHALADLTAASLDETSGIQLVLRAMEEPLRRIVSNAGDDPSVVLA